MNIVANLKLMIPWGICWLFHSLLFSAGTYCEASDLKRTSRNGFNAVRQKRDLLTGERYGTLYPEPRGAFTQAHTPTVAASCPQGCLNGAVCTEAGICDCEIFQANGNRCQIVPNTGKERDGICKSWGQYHFETFDGIYYYFPGNCSYIFAKDCSSPVPQYTVWVHNGRQCAGSVYSCLRSISLFFSGQEEIIISGHQVKKGDVRLALPQTVGNVFIERLADYILVKTTFGFSLAWDGSSGVYIKLTEEYKGKPCGLCGNYNDNRSDDLIAQHTGEHTEDIAVFANSWSIQTPDESACGGTALDFPSPCLNRELSHEAIFFKCQILLQFPFLSCHESIDPYSYISSCMNDLCIADDDETYCRAVTEYARACSHSGYPVRDWRDDFPACTEKCEDNFVHRDCISCCPPTCTFEKECLGSNLHCLDGCYCPDGLIMDNGTCVSVASCPCIYHGTAYPVGSKIEQECSMCVCIGGIWNCTKHDCPAECSVIGDSHFTTFDGRYFTFLGMCQYILVKGTGKEKFTLTLQKSPCGRNLDHACIQSITLVLNDDVNKQVTLTRGGKVQFGPYQGFYPNGDVEIRNLSSMFVQLKTRSGLRIQFAKDGQRLYVQVNTTWKRRTLGLCGTFNGNLRDDFLSPAGMIEGTPQLHANAWKVSSACTTPVSIPIVDPCDVNQQNVGYALHCDIINQELFAACHDYISPALYYQLCRFDACKCGSSCLCNALAHYAYICGKHGIAIDFRSQVSFCAVSCQYGMLYHRCSTYCAHSCSLLSAGEACGDECIEGCNCPDGKFFEESINFCVPISSCRCHYKGRIYQSGEIMPTQLGSCQCLNGTMRCTETATTMIGHTCPEGKIYYDCRFPVAGLPSAGVNCEVTCANLAMNFTCAPSPPCSSGCICPPGMAEHKGKCYIPDSCPCTWKDWEYLSGEVVSTPCYTCVCRRGIFNCSSYPCPAVCTVYGDRHYYTFDGLEYDYVSDCQVYLVKSTDNSNISITAQNKKCFDNDIVCSKSLIISVGDMEIHFSDASDKQRISSLQDNKSKYQLWKAGFYAVVHFPELEITVLWDKKTTIHVKVGPRWKGILAGLCGNFDKYTSNDLTTSNNMEVRNAQVFGESWTVGQCKSPNETTRPCEVHQSKFPYAKKECSILYSDVFAPCRNVIDVTSFIKNCHTDTCNCNLGGDCECLCTSISAYAHKCCQQGVAIHWRSPTVCPYDCEYFNQGLGEGPYILASYGQSDVVLGANVTSRKIFPLPRISAQGNVLFYFMITPGLYKDKDLSLSLVSLESAERPNYFLYVHENEAVSLELWESKLAFRRRATFFHHQGLWIPGFSAFELYSKKGFFIIATASEVKVSKYDNSEEFKHSSSFSIEEITAAVPYRRMCEWRYEPCASPCVKTCGDPEAAACKFLPPVEGCLPYCPKKMILDEITLKCVYPEDCIPMKPTEATAGTKPLKTKPTVSASHATVITEKTPQTISFIETAFISNTTDGQIGIVPTPTRLIAKITTTTYTTLRGVNATSGTLSTGIHELESTNATSLLSYPSSPIPDSLNTSTVTHRTSPSPQATAMSSARVPATLQTSTLTTATTPPTSILAFHTSSPPPGHSTLSTMSSLMPASFSLGTAMLFTTSTTLSSGLAFATSEIPTRTLETERPSQESSTVFSLPVSTTVSPTSTSVIERTSPSQLTHLPLTLSSVIPSLSTIPLKATSITITQSKVPPTSSFKLTSAISHTFWNLSRPTVSKTSPPHLPTRLSLSTTQATAQMTTSSLIRTSLLNTSLSSSAQSHTTHSQRTETYETERSSVSPFTDLALLSPVTTNVSLLTLRATWSSTSPRTTHAVSTLMPSLLTSEKQKATSEAMSSSKIIGPFTASISVPDISQPTEEIMTKLSSAGIPSVSHITTFPISSAFEMPRISFRTTTSAISPSTLPITISLPAASQITRNISRITEYSERPPTVSKTASSLSVTSSTSTLLSTAKSVLSATSAITLQTTASFPASSLNMTSSLTSSVTQVPTTEGLSISPGSSFVTASSVIPRNYTLPGSTGASASTSGFSVESLSTLSTASPSAFPSSQPSHTVMSTVLTSTGRESVSSLPATATHSTMPSTTLGIGKPINTTFITIAPPTITSTSFSLNYSISSKIFSTTLQPSATGRTTGTYVSHFEHYTTHSSEPTQGSSQPSSHTSKITLPAPIHWIDTLSTQEAPRSTPVETAGVMTTSIVTSKEMKTVPSIVSEIKHVPTTGRTAPTTEETSKLHLMTSSITTAPVTSIVSFSTAKPIYPSKVTNITVSDWSKIPPHKTLKPLFNLTESELIVTSQNITFTDSSYPSAQPFGTHSPSTVTEVTVKITPPPDHTSFGTMIHTLSSTSPSECMPRYLEPVDGCSQYVCINMGWMLYNVSRNCHKNVEKPDCGFRGMPVQVNSDSCCPEWECPCLCSVLSELSIITFDGNNIALYSAAPYILVRLPRETIVAHIDKCPPNLSSNSIRKLVPAGGTSGLCFKKLNVTTPNLKVLINRLARKVEVNSIIQPLPFSKYGLCIQDTGAMYVINTPAGINIKWAHLTGIIDIQYGLHSSTSTKTEGLCGICNGDPKDDLKMLNRTIITNMEDVEAFIKSWEIEKSVDVTTRRPVRNCTEDDCTYCMELLNKKAFAPCHSKVSPQDFCEKMWINNTYFFNYECDALSAYVALCNKHNICIKWRTQDYCYLACPEGKEYQACVQPCAAKTCLNKWFYEESPCSYLREDCVCKNGTILHRTESELCIQEEKCACTDNEGQPHSPGEEWNGSLKGCCMYKCLENGSVIAIEPNCSEEPTPACEREGEVVINVIEERACCPKKVCECNMSLCDSDVPSCTDGKKLFANYSPLSCCPEYRCECDPSACPNASRPECREDQFIVEARQGDPCCFSYLCVCESCIEPIPVCGVGEILTVDLNTTQYCCPRYHCVCDENLCLVPLMNCTPDMKQVKRREPEQCCPDWHCECSCENVTVASCKVGEVRRIDPNFHSACGCAKYICEKTAVCLFREVTVLNPGQSMVQYLEGDLCYTVHCLQELDQITGYHAMDISTINCSKQCEAHQIYIPSSDHHICCGTCKNVSCTFYDENGTLSVYQVGSVWVSNCTKYECTKTPVGAMILGSSVVCPPFNDTECLKNGGTVQMYNGGCCKTCKQEEKICQKVIIRTTIRKQDCVSQSPINVASCDGKCPSATIFNVNIDSHLRFCKCCRENGVQNVTVPLYCTGNSTEVMYVIQEPLDCSCQWN
ncbi:otogelin-like protein [Rhinatrema bivittatum]|uniref:otogelin-like protein n=1 Tax=Rhinatrema bivittatum TaxID=194408 RepID=UPI001126B870|nr:otogelin-like protein [Rhinatrema bivittatum]